MLTALVHVLFLICNHCRLRDSSKRWQSIAITEPENLQQFVKNIIENKHGIIYNTPRVNQSSQGDNHSMPIEDNEQFIARIIVLVVAFTLHELAHAIVAVRLGDPTPKKMGRLTLNPIAHLDPIGSIMILFSGFWLGKTSNNYSNQLPHQSIYGNCPCIHCRAYFKYFACATICDHLPI